MAYVSCSVDEGLRPSEVTVEVRDVGGRSQFLRVDKAFVKRLEENSYLPVGIIQRGNNGEPVLIELPHEADSGANRLWVPPSCVREALAKSVALK